MAARRIDASVVSPMEHDFDYPQTVILKRAATRALVTVVIYLDCSYIFGARIPTFKMYLSQMSKIRAEQKQFLENRL